MMLGRTDTTQHHSSVRSVGPGWRGFQWFSTDCELPSSLPGREVLVMLGDMGMSGMMGEPSDLSGARMMLQAWPATLPSGEVSLVATNMGLRTHELVVLPLTPGAAGGERDTGADGRVDETGAVGEASASCAAGSGEGIRPGTAGWVTLSLARGRYELVCNLPHHYAAGMHQVLVVR
jgi:uncharacterized cupredoxin-like copper-binding protein